MGWFRVPVRFVRDLPIGCKLAMTVVGALCLLVGVSWFTLGRLGFVMAMQRDVAAQATVERQVQRSLIAAQELRVVARELQVQQTAGEIQAALERAVKQSETVTMLLRDSNAGQDQKLVDEALARLGGLMDAVRHAATLRGDMLTAEADASTAMIRSGPAEDAVKTDARMAETIGKGIAAASNELVAMTRQLDQAAGAEVEASSQLMRTAFEALAETAADRARQASDTALVAGDRAANDILILVGAIGLAVAVLGMAVIRTLAGPIRRLTRIVQGIASGQTHEAVPYTAWQDEIGRMAASVETLRDVMRQTCIQTQMIEQLPVGVMIAEPTGDCRITHANAEARRILGPVKDFLSISADGLVGQSIDVFHATAQHRRDLIADPAQLPRRTRITLGDETLDLRISAIFDRDGGCAGLLLIWRQATGQVRLMRQFEENVGAIARIVAESASGMRVVASAMQESAIAAGQRTMAVSAASDQASSSVGMAAAATEEMSMSVSEIARQVAESAHVAATAVSDAQATDASVSRLSEAAERISAVVSLISNIAARTNLLALNATIEAARAGDAGKGFAIVAGEVKSLATQTASATNEIRGQIGAMQEATSLAVTALRGMSGTIQRMSEIATMIAGSVKQQDAATHAIAEAIYHAAAGTAEVNSNIAAVTHVVEETGTRASGVLEAATEVTGQASTLKDEVAKFLAAVQQSA